MRGKGLGRVVLPGLIILLGALINQGALAGGCPCPKQKMILLHGTVSMFPSKPLGPRAPQPNAGARRMPVPVMGDLSRPLPTPIMDRMANPLAWNPLFVQQ